MTQHDTLTHVQRACATCAHSQEPDVSDPCTSCGEYSMWDPAALSATQPAQAQKPNFVEAHDPFAELLNVQRLAQVQQSDPEGLSTASMATSQDAQAHALDRGAIIDLISPLSRNTADHDIDFAFRVLDAAQAAQPEPDMRHPKIQALIGRKARLEIELRLISEAVRANNADELEEVHDNDYGTKLLEEVKGLKAQCIKAQPAPEQVVTDVAGCVPGGSLPDWPDDLETFEERHAYQRGVADGRLGYVHAPAQPAAQPVHGVPDARRIALTLIEDLEGRRGVLDGVDDDVKQEMLDTFAEIIEAASPTPPAQQGEPT